MHANANIRNKYSSPDISKIMITLQLKILSYLPNPRHPRESNIVIHTMTPAINRSKIIQRKHPTIAIPINLQNHGKEMNNTT